ncbi:prephenate dehydrogenase [Olsenella sp. AM39-30AC]|jgi:prephenate dehydrogenase|uniref:prephenate dehydrogenase n=1 Tax=Olsenella sp. AM39-30AC TaxID=2292360 RepID=UPI000E49B750|nr:prephenate dehydrogenase [Olsenella sp. AM39-30AC]RHB56981.1 prephenate dehydrogenase [Olsenella sp. AM39-30AC]
MAENNQRSGSSTFVPDRVGVVGLGLMGGSFAKALAAAGREVYGWNRTHSVTEMAEIETIAGELTDQTIPTCELIILAGYPQVSIDWLGEMANLISPGAIVIDTVGVKRIICERCDKISEGQAWTFVGCHPMAGTQYSGFAHARANMFHNAPMVVVPPQMDDFERVAILERLKHLLKPCGFGSFTLSTAENHDRMIAYTSQLAHVVSNAYVKSPTAQEHKGFSAGSYKDLTRVARLNAPMWTELFLDNADNLSREVGTIIENLQAYKDAIDAHDAEKLQALLAEGDRLKREAEAR